MMEWIEEYLPRIFTVILGGGSGFLTKKALDKHQASRIAKIESDLSRVQSKLVMLEGKVESNSALDTRLREELKEHRENLEKRLDRMEAGQAAMIKQQMNFYSEIIALIRP